VSLASDNSFVFPAPGETWSVASAVVEIDVFDKDTGLLLEVSGLSAAEEVTFSLLPAADALLDERSGDTLSCEWHDDATRTWSSEGCRRVLRPAPDGAVTCSCSHLTRFALILRSDRKVLAGGSFEVEASWSNYAFATLYLSTALLALWQIKRMLRETQNPFVRRNFSLAVGSGIRGALQLVQGALYSRLALGVMLTGVAYAGIFGVFCHTARSIDTDPFASLRPLFYLSYVLNALISVGVPLAILLEDRSGQVWLARAGSYGMALVTVGLASSIFVFGFSVLFSEKKRHHNRRTSVLRTATLLSFTFSVQGALWFFSVSDTALDDPGLASQLDILFNACVLAGLWPMLRLARRDKLLLQRVLTGSKFSQSFFNHAKASTPSSPKLAWAEVVDARSRTKI
jgi:hypothetical protein